MELSTLSLAFSLSFLVTSLTLGSLVYFYTKPKKKKLNKKKLIINEAKKDQIRTRSKCSKTK